MLQVECWCGRRREKAVLSLWMLEEWGPNKNEVRARQRSAREVLAHPGAAAACRARMGP